VGWCVDGDLVVAASEVLHEHVAGSRDPCRSGGLETTHRSEPRFEPAVVCFDSVVGVLLRVMQGGRDELVEDSRVGRRPVRGHLNRHRPGGERSGEERPGGDQVASGGQPHVDDLPVLVDRPVQVRPPAVDLDLGQGSRRRTIDHQAHDVGAGRP